MWQCYDRYLNSFSEFKIENIQNKDDLRNKYFSNGLEEQNADVTFRALMGKQFLIHECDIKLIKPYFIYKFVFRPFELRILFEYNTRS